MSTDDPQPPIPEPTSEPSATPASTPSAPPSAPEAAPAPEANGSDPAASGEPLPGAIPLRRPYHQIWSEAALRLVHELTGDKGWTAETKATEPAAQLPVELAAHWELSGVIHGKLAIKLHRAAAHAWARLLMPADTPATSLRTELDAREREALTDFMRRFAEAVHVGLQQGGWGDVSIQIRHIGPLRRRVEDGSAEFPLRLLHADMEPMELDLVFDSTLKEAFRRGPGHETEPVSSAPITANRLDLLLDVELEVTLRFGGRQMLLHDVLELAPGSVLELDRHIDDPVELLVGGKIIAWGEVVVVDGNYGLRITRLVQRSERISAVGARA